MREQVKQILERELERLDTLSQKAGLTLDDFRILDLLIKATKTYAAPSEEETVKATPEKLPIDSLLEGLTDE